MQRDTLLVLSPFERPDAALVAAAHRAGSLGILDLGRDAAETSKALQALTKLPPASVGVRVPDGVVFEPAALPASVGVVVLPAGVALEPWRSFRKLLQVTSLAEALAAEKAGADGLIAKGSESGGRAGEDSAFVLLQRLAGRVSLPVWVQGGVGLYTAAACFAGGAYGVVLDSQTALMRESTLPEDVKTAIAAMDGSETEVIDGYRVFTRPDLPVAELASEGVVSRLGASSLKTNLVPAGADAAFAQPLATRFRTIGGLLRALRTLVPEQIVSARSGEALAEGGPLAAAHAIRYPIAQGPMTRVSDTPDFAEAVSDGGGLPFVALAVMRGPEVKRLLEETARRLEGRTWGVGVLGFVPPELREEQLEVIKQVKPPVALIAGGRPAQARPLEEEGIFTYLHVPSPGLLDLFLTQGARHFVFEGQECGGHVGPRTSFVLWEQQIERLMRQERAEELSVLFAGGVHDARSAAMVATLAAPLAERGAKIGVLMGTAYIFTDEAVAAGAIQAGFQAAAIECERTVLLETAPGHLTRCAETDYVDAFRAERDRLDEAATPPQEVWAALENLNLGRLRIASKGLVREGDSLVSVDAETQRREGMVMLGQVATLHDRRSTIAELHRDVAEGSTRVLADVEVERDERQRPRPCDIAIVGMSAIMPGAPDLATFWSNIVSGVNSITEVPAERWNVETYFDPESMNGEKTPSKWGGFIDPVPFDPLTYGIPPLSLAAIEPVQLLALEVSHRALEDAGYNQRDFDREHTSVIFGAEAGTDLAGAYGFRALWRQYAGDMPDALDEVLPRLTEDSFPGILGNVIAGRIANRLDLGGSNYTVDAACASSLAAVDLACKELVAGSSEMVICGGADLHNSIVDFLAFASVHALSPTGQCRTFDASADGITLGEGVAAVVLKRLDDAVRDGDRVYAVIKSVGSSSDGRSLGLTAPRPEGEARALERAFSLAGVSPKQIGLIEAHGTGTVVGDRTELETLSQVFRRAGAEPAACALGSVKSQIGHTKCAAGLAGLIKAALSLYHRVLPPTLNIETPNPAWDAASPFSLNATARPWPAANRNAGVSAFGFGGTNFHTILSEHVAADEESAGGDVWPSELFLFRGEDQLAGLRGVDELLDLLERDEPWRLRDLARSVSEGDAPVQLAVVASDLDDLRAKLGAARELKTDAAGVFLRRGDLGEAKVAFLLPGQGSQRVGMLRDLFIAFPELQRYLAKGERWARTMFPPTPWSEEERKRQQEAIIDTRVAQPTLGIAGLAMSGLLGRLGVRPDLLAGHSYGELVALSVAGAISEDDLLRLSEVRAQCILDATAGAVDAGSMAAVSADWTRTSEGIAGIDGLVVANENTPEQTVISGETAAVAAAVERFKAAGVGAVQIPVACAFHSPLVAGGGKAFGAALEGVEIKTPALTVFSNTTAEAYPTSAAAIRKRLAEHIGKPVRWASEIEAMYAAGARIFVEAGAGRVLSGFVTRVLGSRPHAAITCDQNNRNGVTQLLLALAQLATAGVEIDVGPLYAQRDAERFDLAGAPSRLPAASAWWVNGQRAWPVKGEPPAYAMTPVHQPVVSMTAGLPATGGTDRDGVVIEYLRGVRELVETQRRVMLSYLGESPEAAASRVAYEPAPLRAAAPVEQPVEAAPAEAVEEEKAPVDVEKVLVQLVSERTGYPAEMLGLDLDLEADLSIDSIKRVEILGVLTQQLGLRGDDATWELPEDVVRVKTLRGIVAAVTELAASVGVADAASATSGAAEPVAPAIEARFEPVKRFVTTLAATGGLAGHDADLAGRTITLVDDGRGIATALGARLLGLGAKATVVQAGESLPEADTFADLSPLDLGWSPDSVVDVFERVRDALTNGARQVLVATALSEIMDGHVNGLRAPIGGGISGLVKSLAKEWPDRTLRIVHLSAGGDVEQMAGQLTAELAAADDEAREVGYTAGIRRIPRVVRVDLSLAGEPTLTLDKNAVILITGGARGITARIAEAAALRFQCRLELVGRSVLSETAEDPGLADATDLPSLRRALAGRGELKEPAAIEAAATSILAGREIRATLARLQDAGAAVTYHAIDVRDEAAFAALIDGIYARYGRLDGVIHGAGVIEDRLARDKTRPSFERVFDTKVQSALTLADHLRDDVRFVAFFSSVSAAFGSRGQSDYAAANDFLDKLAIVLNHRLAGRVVSINWGPWGGGGMISPELAREYARLGVDLIDPELGVESFMSELLYGPNEDAQVILMAAEPGVLA